MRHCRAANVRIITTGFSNIPCFAKFAARWLGEQCLAADPSDKDGVFTIVARDTLEQMYQEQLSDTESYMEIYDVQFQVEVALAFTNGMSLCDKARSISKKWAVDAKCCFKHDAASMAYKVNCTVKTHKPRNKVCIRLLHSASGHSMRGLSAIVNKLFSETLGKIPFSAKNTSDVIRSVSAKRFHHVHFPETRH